MSFLAQPVAIGTAATTLVTWSATKDGSVHGLVLNNGSGSARTVTISFVDNSTGLTTAIYGPFTIAVGIPWACPKPINMNQGDALVAVADAVGVVAMVSGYVATQPLAQSFNVRGAWSSTATYAPLDVVSNAGSSYVAINANTNETPPGADWCLLAAQGIAGAIAPHTHVESDVTGLVSDLAGKASTAPASSGANGLMTSAQYNQLNQVNVQGADLAAASTVNLAAATGTFVRITGTSAISSFATLAAGMIYTVLFTGTPTLIYNATSLILPTKASIAVAAGDTAQFASLGGGNWLCIDYQTASGQALSGSGGGGGGGGVSVTQLRRNAAYFS